MIDKAYCLRLMQESDLPMVHAIEVLSFPTPWSMESLYKEIAENPAARYLVLSQDDEVIAYAGVWLLLDEGHITNLAVHPKHRRKGLASAILAALLRLCCCYGVHAATLEVRPSNQAAIKLYESFGFTVTGLRKGYYTDTKEDALLMWVFDVENREVDEDECCQVFGACSDA